MSRELCITVLMEKLEALRQTPFRTLIASDHDYIRGMLAAMMFSDAIDGNEFRRLNDLAMNVYNVRRNELFELAITRAAA